MKTLRLFLALLAAGVITSGVALAQDNYAAHKGALTNSVPNNAFSMELKPAPTINWGSKVQLTGLLVDIMRPQETVDLFNPYLPANAIIKPQPVVPPPAQPARIDDSDDLAVHRASFVLLKLSFP